MFNNVLGCNWCDTSPFTKIFGGGALGGKTAEEVFADDDNASTDSNAERKPMKQNLDKHEPRSLPNQEKLARAWLLRCNPRVKKDWPSDDAKIQVLKEIIKHIHYTEDPILGKPDDCVTWYGKLNANNEPVMDILDKNGTATTLSVAQTLVYMFADDESYAAISKWPKNKPYERACTTKGCISFVHTVIPE